MKTADITTKETDLEVSYGMFNIFEEPRDAAFTSLKYLYSDLTDIRKYYIRLGFHLEEFSRCEYYRDFGFLTLEEFCDKNLGLDKSAVSRCINVYRAFNASNTTTCLNGIKSTGSAIELDEKWKDYSYTQLCEMLPLTPDQRKDISPDMSVKQIREYKKRIKPSKKPDPCYDNLRKLADNISVASTQPEVFDHETYINKKGFIRNNYVRDLEGTPIVLHTFDSNGKEIAAAIPGDFLGQHEGHYFIRLEPSVEINVIEEE